MEERRGCLPRAVIAATILGTAAVGACWAGLRIQVGFREAAVERAREERDEQRKAVRQVEALEDVERELVEIERISLLRSDPHGPVRATARPRGLRIDGLDLEAGTIVVRGWTSGLGTLADWLEALNRSRSFAEPDLREVRSQPELPGTPSARRGHRFTVLLAERSAEAPESGLAFAETSSESEGAGEVPPGPPPSPIPPSSSRTRIAHVPVEDLEVLEIHLTSSGPVARAGCRGEPCWIREGDLLQDGEVAWIGFFSERLAAVRLKRRVWPPDGGRPYREELRVLGWDALAEPPAASPEPYDGSLHVAGREALGSWPDGRYSNPRETLVEPGGRGPLPAVDLFAAVFHELYGLFPWQHESWSHEGWTVEMGFPWRGSILGLEHEDAGEARRDPFRSLLDPGKALQPFKRPGGLAGLLIDEIELEEVYDVAGQGPVAEAGSYGSFRPWILRPGDELGDGRVSSISPFAQNSRSPGACGEVVFQQVVKDPLARKAFRRVIKRPGHRPWPCLGPAAGQSRDAVGRPPA